jgi:two-component system chemotaxis response regulator CheB
VVANTTDIQTPSIDELLASAAAVYGPRTVGVILTGMGSDGALGMSRVKDVGGSSIVQDQATSIIYGMAREVVERGFADSVVPLGSIISTVNEYIR